MDKPDFYIIPSVVLDNPALRPLDGKVFGVVYWLTKLKLEKCVASNRTLAFLANSTVKSVQDSLGRLEKSGVIGRIYADPARKIRSEIVCNVSFNANVPSNKGTVPSNTDTRVPSNADHNKKSIKKKSITTTNVVAEAYGKPEINELFTYWQETTGLAITARTVPNRRAASNLLRKYGSDKLRRLIDGVAVAQSDQYAPRIADFTQLQNKADELILWGKKKSTNQKRTIKI